MYRKDNPHASGSGNSALEARSHEKSRQSLSADITAAGPAESMCLASRGGHSYGC